MAIKPPEESQRLGRVLCVGSIAFDHVYALDAPLIAGSKSRARTRCDVGGGVAANAAVTVSRLGGKAALIGCVGVDHVGEQVLEGLRAELVDVDGIRCAPSMPTAESIVISEPNGERTVLSHTTDQLLHEPAPDLVWSNFGAVLVDARWPAATVLALTMARNHGVPGVVDVDRIPGDEDLVQHVLDLASHLVFSQAALLELTGIDNPTDALRALRPRTRADLSVTLGSKGMRWLNGDHALHLDAFDITPVDTTGAGDVFHGAFALALAEGKTNAAGFQFASAAAALKCTRPNARCGIPTRDQVRRFLADHPTTWRSAIDRDSVLLSTESAR